MSNIVKPKYKITEQVIPIKKMDMGASSYKHSYLSEMYKHIELCGRTCYQSSSLIKDGSAEKFVNRMINDKHYAMLEHGAIYLKIPDYRILSDFDLNKYEKNAYSHVSVHGNFHFVTTNYRVIIENGWERDLEYLCYPEEYHDRRITVNIISDIHFYKDTTRHRVFSWAIQSTRFIDYMKEKYGMSIDFLMPAWLTDEDEEEFKKDIETVEKIYFKWRERGWKPEQAAYFLIQGTKAEIVMTGYASDFRHFFALRACEETGPVHPTVKEITKPLMEEFKAKNYI